MVYQTLEVQHKVGIHHLKKLLVLEDYFHRKTLTLDAVNELVGCYVQSVEQF